MRQKAAERRATKKARAAVAGPTPLQGRVAVPCKQLASDNEVYFSGHRSEAKMRLREASKELQSLRARGSPARPGPKPTRRRGLPAWNDARRAREVWDGKRAQLEKKQGDAMAAVEAASAIDAHQPLSYEDASELANKEAELPPQGVEIDLGIGHQVMRGVGQVGRRPTFKAPKPAAASQQPAQISPIEQQRRLDYARVEQQAERVLASTHEAGRKQAQSAATEMRAMVAAADGQQKERLARMQDFEKKQQRAAEVTENIQRSERVAKLAAAAEGDGSVPEPPRKGSRLWRVEQALKLKRLVRLEKKWDVAADADALAVICLMASTHKVVYWVPDAGWHLARGILDELYPQRNGVARSNGTAESRNRKVLSEKLSGETISWPIAVVVCGGGAVLTEAQLAKAQALQRDCDLGVCVCAVFTDTQQGTKNKSKKQARKKRPCPSASNLHLDSMLRYYRPVTRGGLREPHLIKYYDTWQGGDHEVYRAAAAAVEARQAENRPKPTPAAASAAVRKDCDEEELAAEYSAL